MRFTGHLKHGFYVQNELTPSWGACTSLWLWLCYPVTAVCHNCDSTYPYLPYPNLSMSFLSHQNHPQAPFSNPKSSGPILSQLLSHQHTPEPSDFLAPHLHIPDTYTHFSPNAPLTFSSSYASSPFLMIPLVSRLWLGEAQSRTSLAWCILVCPFSPSIYLSSSLFTLSSSICIPSLHWPYWAIPYFPYDSFLITQIILILTTPHTCINTLVTSCCSLSQIINFNTLP